MSLLIRIRSWIPALLVGAVPLAVLPGAVAQFHTGKWTLVLTLVPFGLAVAAVIGPIHWPRQRWFLVWIVVAAAASLFGVAPWMSLAGSPNRNAGIIAMLVGTGAFVLGASTGNDARVQRSVLRAAFISGGIVGLLGIVEWAGLDLFGIGDLDVANRARSSWGSATFTAAHIVMVLPIAIAHIRSRDALWRVAALISTATMSITLVLTGTRAAWLAAAVGAVLMVPAWLRSAADPSRSGDSGHPRDGRDDRRKKLLVGAGALVVVVVAAVAMLPSLGRTSAVGRIDLWGTSVTVIADRPVIGSGLDTQRVTLPSGITPSFEADHGSTELHDRAHNIVLDTLLTTGIVGLAALATLLFFLAGDVRKGLGRMRRNSVALVPTAIAAGLVAYLVTLLFAFGDSTIDPIAWLLTGLLLAGVGATNPAVGGSADTDDAPPPTDAADAMTTPDRESPSRLARRATASVLVLCAVAGLVWGGGEIVGEYRLSSALDSQSTNHTDAAVRSLQTGSRLAPARFDLDQIAARLITNSLENSVLIPVPGSATRLTGDQEQMRTDMITYALRRLDRAEAVAGDDTDVMMDQAELLTAAGRPADALELYDRILQLYPNSFRAHLGRGLAAVDTGDQDLAERSWLTAADLGPRDPRAWSNLGVLYEQLGDKMSASEAFESALRVTPDDPAAQSGLERVKNTEGN